MAGILPEELQQLVEFVNRQYPWATEDTVQRLAELSRSNNIKTIALAAGIQKALGAADAKRLEAYIKQSTSEVNKSIKTSAEIARDVKAQTRDLTKTLTGDSQQGIENMTNLAHATSQALDKLGEAAGDFLDNFGKFGRLADMVIGSTTASLTAFTGVATIFSSLIAEQEKQLRGMIDQGIVLDNLARYTNIRGQLANIGLTINEYNDVLAATAGFMTRDAATGKLEEGSSRFLNFLSKSSTLEQTRHFGYTPREVTKQLAQEAELLYKINEINSLNSTSEQRVIDSFATVNKMALFMSEAFGIQRSALLEQRRQAREVGDFIIGMNMNAELMNERYGEGTSRNISQSYDTMIFLAGLLGEEFQQFVTENAAGFVHDLKFDESLLNNIKNTEFFKSLQMIGPEAAAKYVDLTEKALTGQMPDQAEVAARFLEIIQSYADAKPLLGIDEASVNANRLISIAKTLPADLSTLTREEIQNILDETTQNVDGADNTIEGIGELSRIFLQAQHQITPGYQSMGVVLDVLDKSILEVANLLSSIFGTGVEYKEIDSASAISSAQSRLNQSLVDSELGNVSNFGSPGGRTESGTSSTSAGSTRRRSPAGTADSDPVGTLSDQLEQLETNLEKARTQKAELEERLEKGFSDEENDKFISDMEDTITSLQEQISLRADRLLKTQEDALAKQKELRSAREKFDDFIADASNNVDSIQQEINTAIDLGASQNEIAALIAEKKLADAALVERKAAAAHITEEITKLETEWQQLADSADELKSLQQQSEAELNVAETGLLKANEDINAYRKKIVSDALEIQTKTVADLETEVETVGSRLKAEQEAAAARIAERSSELGTLSAKYESAKGGALAIGRDSGGGFSYGTYQIATKTGTFKEYMNFLSENNEELYKQLEAAGGSNAALRGTAQFKSAWKSLMQNEEYAKTQHAFIQATHYEPARRKIEAETGVDIGTRSKALQDVLWSSSVQHGAGRKKNGKSNGALRLFENAIRDLGKDASDEDIIRHVYRGRTRYLSKLTANEQAAVRNRYRNEVEDAYAMLRQEREDAARLAQAKPATIATTTPVETKDSTSTTQSEITTTPVETKDDVPVAQVNVEVKPATIVKPTVENEEILENTDFKSQPANVQLAELQAQQTTRINAINSITEDPSRLNTTTGNVDMQGLDESQIEKLSVLERQLQNTLKEIANLQSRTGAL